MERLRGALKGPLYAGRHANVEFGLIDLVHCIAERESGGQVERQRHCREHALVIHRQCRVGSLEMREVAERNEAPVLAPHTDGIQRIRVLLILLLHFHHDVILVQRRVHGRDLALSE